ncbi:MAG: hypothetical protein E7A68_19450 [Phocaeicola vulgatus]|nr:hypothetical protein [Phocaeicola vulgatus]
MAKELVVYATNMLSLEVYNYPKYLVMDVVTDFIIERLKKLDNMFKGISIKYAFDSMTDFHIIEISPENIRRRDDEYIRWELDMWNDFFAMFPDEDLLISESCESNDMHNVLFSNIPSAYGLLQSGGLKNYDSV